MYAGLQELASTLTTLMKAGELQEGKGKHICLGTGTTDVSRMMEEQKNRTKQQQAASQFLNVYQSVGLVLPQIFGHLSLISVK